MIEPATKERWWVLEDSDLRYSLNRVESGEVTAEEIYAWLIEHSEVEK